MVNEMMGSDLFYWHFGSCPQNTTDRGEMQPQVISDLGIAVLLYRLSHAGIPFMSVSKLARFFFGMQTEIRSTPSSGRDALLSNRPFFIAAPRYSMRRGRTIVAPQCNDAGMSKK